MVFTTGICTGCFSNSVQNLGFCAPAKSKLGKSCVRRAGEEGQTAHIARLVVLEIADRELAIEAIIVLFCELIVPRRAALCSVIAEESAWRLGLCSSECVCRLYLCDAFKMSNSVTGGCSRFAVVVEVYGLNSDMLLK